MATKELLTVSLPVSGLNYAHITGNTTTVGNIIDMQGYEGLKFIISGLTITDGTYTPLIEDGEASNLSDAAAVIDDYLVGGTLHGVTPVILPEANAAITASNTEKQISYIGKKRYVRISLVSTSVSSGGYLHVVADKEYPKLAQINSVQ
jgi:hypothetical protein